MSNLKLVLTEKNTSEVNGFPCFLVTSHFQQALSGLSLISLECILQEDMKSFVLNNWSPALQAAFGDHWREHFQSKPQHARSDDDSGASSSHVFEGFLPMSPAILEDAPGEEQHYGSPGCSDKELPSEAERDFYLGRGGKIRNFETRSMEVCLIPTL